MNETNKLWTWVWIIIGIPIIIAIILWPDKKEPGPVVDTGDGLITYNDSDYGLSFTYPTSWADPIVKPGNKECPEEDTYRTPDTLSIYDREISFPDFVLLPNSESFIRAGVRIYELDPKDQNDCGDELLARLASGEFDGRALSSVRLTPVDFTFAGYYNPEASRLNTEGREQFLLFALAENPEKYLVMQPYMSFIPHFGSPELSELENDFDGDMQKYLAEGRTATPIREYAARFRLIAESLRISVE